MIPGRHGIFAVVGLPVVVLGAVVALRLAGSDEADRPVAEILTDVVGRRTLRDEITIRGELRRDELQTINSPFDGRVSQLAVDDGDQVEPSDVLLALDGRPAVAATGDFSFYRSLDVGSDGPDVLQLERILSASGYDPGRIDSLYTEATRAALAAWQIDHGYGGATPEPEETVVITLSTNVGYRVGGRNTVAVTIGPSVPGATPGSAGTGASVVVAQVDPIPVIAVAAAELSVAEGATVDVVLTATPAPITDTQVDLTIGGSAVADDDYEELASPFVWPAGAASVSVSVTTFADSVLDPDETITIEVAEPLLDDDPTYGAGPLNLTTVTVVDASAGRKPTIRISVDDGTIDEGQGAVFRVTSDLELGTALEIRWAVSGSAVEVDDYAAIDDDPVVVLPAGATETTFTIATVPDDVVEGEESITVTLQPNDDADHDYLLGDPGAATAVVADTNEPEITLRGGGAIAEGGAAAVTIVADQAPGEDLSVNYQVSGSATPGVDYRVLTGTVVLRAGHTQVSVSIDSLDDDVVFKPSDLIIADWPARVGSVFVDEGETVQLGQPLLNLTEPDFTIRLFANPTDRSELAVGQAVSVSIEAGDQEAEGVIAELDDEATIDESGGETYEGVVEVVADLVAVEGANVVIDVLLEERVDTLVVPLAAVGQDGSGEEVVRVVDQESGAVTRVAVTTGLQEGSFVEVVSGLVGGELVIVDVTGGG
ncbi:MAG: Calx-beta domain-containing protein [Acidimicrobiales bacterium]